MTKRVTMELLEEETLDLCRILAEKDPNILNPIKSLLNNFYLTNYDRFLEIEREAFDATVSDDSSKLDDFLQKLWSK